MPISGVTLADCDTAIPGFRDKVQDATIILACFIPNVVYFQEQLLLSVMPAHLAEEMKTKMLNKLRKPKGKNGELTRRKSAYGRFQDLYIRVYDNVR